MRLVWMTWSLTRVDLYGKRMGESQRKHEPMYLSSKFFATVGWDQWFSSKLVSCDPALGG